MYGRRGMSGVTDERIEYGALGQVMGSAGMSRGVLTLDPLSVRGVREVQKREFRAAVVARQVALYRANGVL